MKHCPKCEQKHEKPGMYCSRSCANSRGPRTDEFKTSMKLRFSKSEERLCEICGSTFTTLPCRKKRSCSKECRIELDRRAKKGKPKPLPNTNTSKPKKGHHRGHSGWYKGFALDSRYELAYVIYCLHHNKDITRYKGHFDYFFEGKLRRFFPDFIVDGVITEIKGFRSPVTDAKISSVTCRIDVLYKDDLEDIFKEVEIITGVEFNQLQTLYDVR